MAYFYSPFRKKYEKSSSQCPFCDDEAMNEQVVRYKSGEAIENKNYRWIINTFPKFDGHTMIVPKKHIHSLGSETVQSIRDREELMAFASDTLRKLYPGAGIEIFLQTGEGAMGSIEHFHWHIVPARPSDPLRSFDKLGQFYTIKKDEPKLLVFPVPIQRARGVLLRALARTLGTKKEV